MTTENFQCNVTTTNNNEKCVNVNVSFWWCILHKSENVLHLLFSNNNMYISIHSNVSRLSFSHWISCDRLSLKLKFVKNFSQFMNMILG